MFTPERNVSFAGLSGCGSLESTKDDPSFRPSERGELNFCLIPPAEAGRSSSSTCFLRSRRASLCWRSSRRGAGGGSFHRKLSRKRNRRSRAFRRVSMARWDHHMERVGDEGGGVDDLGPQCSLNVALRSVGRRETDSADWLSGSTPAVRTAQALLVEEKKVAKRRHGGRPESRARRRHAASEQPTEVSPRRERSLPNVSLFRRVRPCLRSSHIPSVWTVDAEPRCLMLGDVPAPGPAVDCTLRKRNRPNHRIQCLHFLRGGGVLRIPCSFACFYFPSILPHW